MEYYAIVAILFYVIGRAVWHGPKTNKSHIDDARRRHLQQQASRRSRGRGPYSGSGG